MPHVSKRARSSKRPKSKPSWRNWKAGETNCGNRTGSVFLNVFNLMYAKPLDVTRILCPRIFAVDTRNVREEATFHGQNPGMSTNSVRLGTVHGLDLSVSANYPCSRSVRARSRGHKQSVSANELRSQQSATRH